MKAIMTVLALALISLNTWAIDATHGMVLFGSEKLMAYHLPMFHNIHAKQVVLEYTVPEKLKAKLLSIQTEDFLTFVPEKFDLEKFLVRPFPLKGDVYKGHFEKDGELIISDVTLENITIIHARNLTKVKYIGSDRYKLVGTPTDLYLIHLLDGGKHVDHIIKATINTVLNDAVKLTNKAITAGYNLVSESGLLKDDSVSTMYLPLTGMMNPRDPACYPLITRACKIWSYEENNELEIMVGKTYFTDDVM